MTHTMEQMTLPGLEETAPFDSLRQAQGNAQGASVAGRSRWPMVKLGDVCALVKGVTASFFNQNSEFEYIDIASIDREAKRIIGTSTIPSKEAPSRAKQPVSTGDILVSTVRPNLNAVAKVNDYHDGAIASSGFCVLRPLNNKILPEYLFFFTRTNTFVDYLNSLATGASYPAVSDKIVKSAQIPLPPLPEQQRIVARLDQAQQLIDQRKEQLKLMDALVQSLFYEMFGDPVKNEKGWEVKALGEFVSFKHGYAFSSEFFSDSGSAILLTPGNFHEKGGFRFRGEKQKFYTGPIPDEFILSEGDMLVAMTEQAPGLLGSPLFVPTSNIYLHNQRLGLAKIDHSVYNDIFLFCYFNSPYFRDEVQFTSTGTKVKHTSPSKLQAIQSIIPPLPLQQTFADRVQQIEALKQQMMDSLAEMEQNFNALMQEAFG